MGEHKHGDAVSKAKKVQVKQEDEQGSREKPSEALARLSGNVARPADVHALQKSVGNRVIQRFVQASSGLVQRSFTDDPEYRSWRARMVGAFGPMTDSLRQAHSHHGSEGEALGTASSQHDSAAQIWNEASIGGGGGAETTTESGGGEEGETAATEGD